MIIAGAIFVTVCGFCITLLAGGLATALREKDWKMMARVVPMTVIPLATMILAGLDYIGVM